MNGVYGYSKTVTRYIMIKLQGTLVINLVDRVDIFKIIRNKKKDQNFNKVLEHHCEHLTQ